jgi:predicted acylesterase/phospholipase RssA
MIPTPFTNIALSLSGGGYRATTFHLGAMGYLNAQSFNNGNLLENVKIISTISGGTITGVMYAHVLANGGNYQDCFDKIYRLLSKDELVSKAFYKLNHPGEWVNEYKSRDVINAFSEVYHEDFFDEATFEELFDAEPKHLSDAIFGTSEFTYGIQFRLQQNNDNAKFGNRYLHLPDDVAKKIRLADATAASSCFPGGFEPMIMPNDFGNGPKSAVVDKWNEKSFDGSDYPPTAIMDGGIIDNQGIEGVKLAEERAAKREGKPYIGTYLCSDVCKDMMSPYQVPVLEHSTWKDIITLRRINILSTILLILLILGLLADLPRWTTIASSALLTFIGIYFILFYLGKNLLKSALHGSFGGDAVPGMMQDLGVLTKTPIYILSYLIKFRVSSVVKMVSELFLRRIRRLQLDALYRDKEWNYRFKSNYIYSLSKSSNDVSPELMETINMANNMPTTLWFTTEEKDSKMLDHLIAAGQITMCHNLIKYIKRIRDGKYKAKVWAKLCADDQNAIETLESSLKEDWKKFNDDPFWLLQREKNKTA